MRTTTLLTAALAGAVLAGPVCRPVRADLAISSNDAHTVLRDGVQVAADGEPRDTVSVIDVSSDPPRLLHTLEAPGSVVGPPMAVAVARDESFAIVTGATKAQAGAPNGIAPDDRVSVIDLRANPPKVVQTLQAGAGATTVRITPDGQLAIVVNRTEGSLSLFAIRDGKLEPAGKTEAGGPSALPSGLAFTRDGKVGLLTRYGDHQIRVLRIDGTKVTTDARPITAGIAPYTIDVNAAGTLAAVGNMGRGDGDADSVSLIDLSQEPFRTVLTQSVAESPEGLRWAPDGRTLAIGAQNGTAKPQASPFRRDGGRLILLDASPAGLRAIAEAPIGRWSQGIAFSRDGKMVLVQNMVERTIQVFHWNDTQLSKAAAIPIGAGPAAIQTAW